MNQSIPEKTVKSQPSVPVTSVHTIEADGIQIFYRAAGDATAPILLLLHGFPTSSFMFRDLILRLADRYRVIAPDLPGFGFTVVPEKEATRIRSTRWPAQSKPSQTRLASTATRSMYSTMERLLASVSQWPAPNESQQSSRKTATPTKKDSAMRGGQSGLIGLRRQQRIER